MIDILKLYAEIKFKAIYTCCICGEQEKGDTSRMGIEAFSFHEFIDKIKQIELRASDMPVNWRVDGNIFRCPKCKDT